MEERKTEGKDESLNEEGWLVPLLSVKGDGEIGQLLLLGTCFQLCLQNSTFNPFSLLATMCPLVQHFEQERWWAVGDHSRFAVLGSLLPCAHACSSSLPTLPPVMGQEGNAKLCLQVAYLFHSLATLHLFRCCSGMHTGEIFSCLSIPEDVWLVGFFYYYFGKLLFHFSVHFFIVSLCEHITNSQFAMDCRCCRGELFDSVSNCAIQNY